MQSRIPVLSPAAAIDRTFRLARARQGGKFAPSATADRASAGNAGLTVLREGRQPVRGVTPVPRGLDAQRNGPAPRSGDTPRPTETWHAPHHRIGLKRRLE